MDIENSLLAQAQAKGVSIHDYVEQIIEQQARQAAPASQIASQAQNLYELFAPVRGLLTDEEVDTLFARNRSPSRTVDL